MLLRSGRGYYNQHNSFEAFFGWYGKNVISLEEVEEEGGDWEDWMNGLGKWCNENNHIIYYEEARYNGVYNLDAW